MCQPIGNATCLLYELWQLKKRRHKIALEGCLILGVEKANQSYASCGFWILGQWLGQLTLGRTARRLLTNNGSSPFGCIARVEAKCFLPRDH
jgi:hypothetical protein